MFRILAVVCLTVLSTTVLCIDETKAQERVFAEVDGVQLVSIPQPSPGSGLVATKIQARTINPSSSVVTFTNLKISHMVQLWVPSAFGSVIPTPVVADIDLVPEWVPLDSHLLISSEMVGGGAGAGYSGITETNDHSPRPQGLPCVVPCFEPTVGQGDIAMYHPSDAFFLARKFQKDSIDLAYLVVDESAGQSVELTLGVLGASGDARFNSEFGYDEAVIVPFTTVPETGLAPVALVLLLAVTMCRRSKFRT